MSFILKQGKVKTQYFPVTPSTALTKDSLVTFTSGKIVAATSSTANTFIEGVIRKTIAATDTDYATDRLVPVDVPVERFTVWEFDVTSGLVAADIGLECDLTNATTVNRGASSVDVVKVTKVISTTLGQGYIKFGGAY